RRPRHSAGLYRRLGSCEPGGWSHLGVTAAEAGMHDFVLAAGRAHAGFGRLGAVAEAHHHLHLGAHGLLVEFERFLAASIKEQIGLHLGRGLRLTLHDKSPWMALVVVVMPPPSQVRRYRTCAS